MTEGKEIYRIGETYSNRHASRAGIAVIRPAVYQRGVKPKVVTSSPCCTTEVRKLDFGDLMSDPAGNGWLETCKGCGWHYTVSLEYTSNDPQLGLYGVRWVSSGF